MFALKRRVVAVVGVMAVLMSMGLDTRSAGAVIEPGHPTALFRYHIDATTHIKKLDQDITVQGGEFRGIADLATGELEGEITLPETTFTYQLAGIVPVVTATARIVPVGPITGMINFRSRPIFMETTAVFNIRIISAYAPGVPVNLVGDICTTNKPVSVTMAGPMTDPLVFSGTFTLPNFRTCQNSQTVLNLLLPGPDNTFSATAY